MTGRLHGNEQSGTALSGVSLSPPYPRCRPPRRPSRCTLCFRLKAGNLLLAGEPLRQNPVPFGPCSAPVRSDSANAGVLVIACDAWRLDLARETELGRVVFLRAYPDASTGLLSDFPLYDSREFSPCRPAGRPPHYRSLRCTGWNQPNLINGPFPPESGFVAPGPYPRSPPYLYLFVLVEKL